MSLTQAWRWYGPNDIVSLSDIEQSGATCVVHALHSVPVGEVWEIEDIQRRKELIEVDQETGRKRKLTWGVIESLNVHKSIRQGLDDRDEYIEKYIQSLKNLSSAGITIVCYNFMPLLDWTRTDLKFEVEDQSLALRFDWTAYVAFDLFILQRLGAENNYSDSERKKAEIYFSELNTDQVEELTDSILQGVPGTSTVLSISEFKELLESYSEIDEETFRENFVYFLERVIPEAEKLGIKMCCHPDDPPFNLFGIPRIVSTEKDLKWLVESVTSPSNGITFCSGSLGPNKANDLPKIISELGSLIHFVHLRNVQREEGKSFFEANHLEGSVDMFAVMQGLVVESKRRASVGRKDASIPYRPDHGHQMLDDLNKEIPFHGYSAIGRLRGLSELRGLELGIERSSS